MFILLLLSFESRAQERQKDSLNNLAYNISTLSSQPACFAQIDLNDIPRLPIVTILLKFHFVKDAQGNNFQCSNPNAPYYAPTYVQQIIDGANLAFSDPAPSTYGSSPDLPDARIRYQLAGSPIDPCSAIFIEETEPVVASTDAIHIIIIDGAFATNNDMNGNCSTGGVANIGTSIKLFNIHCNVFQAGWPDIARYGTLMNHELGHWFGLCHAYAADNPCADMIPEFECAGPTSTVAATGTSCDASGNFDSVCFFGNGNNMMGENGDQSGLTLCQWSTLYGNMNNLRPKPAYLYFKNECEPVDDKPTSIIIPTNTIEQWDDFRFVDQPIEIESNATLIITCEVRMALEQPIIVHRGGRLFVQGGTITSQGPDCLWGGIYVSGNSSMAQPDVVTARTAGAMLPSGSAGVVWLNSATILNAPTAVTTKGYGDDDLPAYWGGLVMANTTDFINNSRAAEFMKYDQGNKSYFKNCEIKKNGSISWSFNRGVSIWACSGIEFTDNFIDGTTDYGIQCWNAVATIKGGAIRRTKRGLSCDFSMPNIFLDANSNPQKLLVDDVDFEGNFQGIYSNSSPNLLYPFTISRNNFKKITPIPPPGIAFDGIRILGESSFFIGPDNNIDGIANGISVQSNGEYQNRVYCNTLSNLGSKGVAANFDNRGLSITGNHFLNGVGNEILVTGTSFSKGMIKEDQQLSNTVEAGNCFDVPNNAITADVNKTVKFKYHVYDLQNTPDVCKVPGIGNNNYTLEFAGNEFPLANCLTIVPPGLVSEEDLKEARELTEQLKSIWEENPEDESAKSAWLQAASVQASYLSELMKTAGETKDFNKAEDLLLGEKTNKALREAVGMRTALKDYNRAQALLDSMPVLVQDDAWFKEIMAVNFDMFQAPGMYELTPAQEDTLMKIADTPQSLMSGYACAILSICKGYECAFDTTIIEEEERSISQTKPTSGVKLFPNPTSGLLNIECSDHLNEMLTFDLYDLSGRKLKSLRFQNTGLFTVDCSPMPTGAYYVRLYHESGTVHILKVHITH